MRDYAETVDRLRRCEQFKCRGCEYESIFGCRAKLNADAADAIEELQAQVPHWISVEERLPKQGKRYLVLGYFPATNKPFIEILWHDAHDLWWNRLYKGDHSVTHWMPLPAPPKEDAECKN